MGAALLLLVPCLCPASADEGGWREHKGDFKYKSGLLSCTVNQQGVVRDIRIPDALLVQDIMIHAQYDRRGDKHDSRLFQTWAPAGKPLRVMKQGADACLLRKDGILKNKKYERAARFTQTLTLSPRELVFRYEIETLVEMGSKQRLFRCILSIPSATFHLRGGRIGGRVVFFPGGYSKANAIRAGGFRELELVLDRHNVSFTAAPGSQSGTGGAGRKLPGAEWSIQDRRAWGGEGYRLDVEQARPRAKKTIVYPPGTVFSWGFCIRVE